MKILKRTVLFIAAAAVLAGLFAGCSEKAPDAGDKAKDEGLRKVTVLLDWVPNTNHTGLYAAKSKGYFEEEGLEVSIEQPSAGGSADLVAANKGEFGISYQEQVTYARTAEKPLPVKAIAAVIQHNTSGFAAPAAKNIKTPKDFEGKKYGSFGSLLEERMLKALMKKYDADYNKLTSVNIGTMDYFSAVGSAVDFSWIYYGWDGVAAETRNFPIDFLKLQDLDPRLDFYTPVIIANDQLLEKEPELARKFLKAAAKGYKYAIENPEDAVEAFLAASPETDRDLAVASQKYLAGEYMAEVERWGEMKESTWSSFGGWMLENGLIERALKVDEAFTNEFLPK